MGPNLAEILGMMLGILGLAAITGAAAMVSIPLAVLTAGVSALFVAVLVIYAANAAATATAKAEAAAVAAQQVRRYTADN